MIRCQVLTTWTGQGTDANPNHPKLADDYTLLKWKDVSGTPAQNIAPAPNTLIVEAILDDTVFTNLDADANYQGCILWAQTYP